MHGSRYRLTVLHFGNTTTVQIMEVSIQNIHVQYWTPVAYVFKAAVYATLPCSSS